MPTQEDMQNNRRRALSAAYRCFMAHGLPETSIASVAKESGLSSRSIRRYFGSEKKLIEEMIEKVMNPRFLMLVDGMRRSAEKAGSGIEQVEQLLIRAEELSASRSAPLLRLMEAQLFLFQNQSDPGARNEPILEGCRLLEESIARGVADGSICPDIDRTAGSLIFNLFIGFLQRMEVAHRAESGLERLQRRKQAEMLIRGIIRDLSDSSSISERRMRLSARTTQD